MDISHTRDYLHLHERYPPGPVFRPDDPTPYLNADPAGRAFGHGHEHFPAQSAEDGRAFRHGLCGDPAFGAALPVLQRDTADFHRADFGQPRAAAGDALGLGHLFRGYGRLSAGAEHRRVSGIPHGAGRDRHGHGAEPCGDPRPLYPRRIRLHDRLCDDGHGAGADDQPRPGRFAGAGFRLAGFLLGDADPRRVGLLGGLGGFGRNRPGQRQIAAAAVRRIPRVAPLPPLLGLCSGHGLLLGRLLCLSRRRALCGDRGLRDGACGAWPLFRRTRDWLFHR